MYNEVAATCTNTAGSYKCDCVRPFWDGDGTVSKKEFRKAMPMLGLQVSKRDIDALFDSWDPDGSGQLELGELNKVPT